MCYSLTLLYGVQLASSLAILKPPRFPSSFKELEEVSEQIISLQAIFYKYKFQSRLATSLNETNTWSGEGGIGAHFSVRQRESRANLINKINKGYCDDSNILFNRSTQISPYQCENTSYLQKWEVPVTFVDYGHFHLLERYVFQEPSKYWVSSTTTLPYLRDTYPMLISKNYFAKLALPIASLWVASGLQTVWAKVEEEILAIQMNSGNMIILDSNKRSESTTVVGFTPLALRIHKDVLAQFAIFLGIVLLTLLAEWLSAHGIICVIQKKRTKSNQLREMNTKQTGTHGTNFSKQLKPEKKFALASYNKFIKLDKHVMKQHEYQRSMMMKAENQLSLYDDDINDNVLVRRRCSI